MKILHRKPLRREYEQKAQPGAISQTYHRSVQTPCLSKHQGAILKSELQVAEQKCSKRH